MTEPSHAGGLVCRACGARRDRVTDTRGNPAGTVIRRRRVCDACGRRWSTHETEILEGADRLAPGEVCALAGQLRALAEALDAWAARGGVI